MLKSTVLFSVILLAGCSFNTTPQTFGGEEIIQAGSKDTFIETIDHPDYPSVLLSSDHKSIAVGIYQAKTGQPYAVFSDKNGDGVFDLLTYSLLSQDGELLVEIEDYGMDGQADFRIDFKNSTASVYYKGKWRNVEGIGTEKRTVTLEKQVLPLEAVLEEIGRNAF